MFLDSCLDPCCLESSASLLTEESVGADKRGGGARAR